MKETSMKSIFARSSTIVAAIAISMLGVIAACSSDETAAAPSRPPTPPPNTNNPQADGGNIDPSGDGGIGPDCFDTAKAKPVQQTDFFNQCNGGQCFPFDNAARIEGFVPGAPLPPLN
jgi:hypothetical protein